MIFSWRVLLAYSCPAMSEKETLGFGRIISCSTSSISLFLYFSNKGFLKRLNKNKWHNEILRFRGFWVVR